MRIIVFVCITAGEEDTALAHAALVGVWQLAGYEIVHVGDARCLLDAARIIILQYS